LIPNSGLSALIGINGSGKSNLLSAILLLKKATSASIRRFKNEDEEYVNQTDVYAEFECDGSSIAFEGKVFYLTNNQNIDQVNETQLKWNLENITGEKGWIELPIEMLSFRDEYRVIVSADSSKRLTYEEIARDGWFEHRLMENILPRKVVKIFQNITEYLAHINYYSASQFSDPSRCPISLEFRDNRPTRRQKDCIDHEQFMHDLYRSYISRSTAFSRFMNIIGSNGIGLVDNLEFDTIHLPNSIVDVRAGGKMEKKERTNIVVVPTFLIDGNKLSPHQLSEGTFKTLALLFYVLTDDSQLLLVEEPEVCIHHGLLNSILELIKDESRRKQIIISTHSDFVLDHLKPENVILVDRIPNKGTKAGMISEALSKEDYKALKQYLKDSGSLGEYWRAGGFSDV
jgi:ABC-type lipoprotein export system ATPase subunit